MTEDNLGYYENPKNGEGVIRAKTTGQLRSWELPRSFKALETLNKELEKIEFPSIYILLCVEKLLRESEQSKQDKTKIWKC